MTEHETPHAGTRPDAPAAVTADMEAQIARARKRMRRWIMLVAILGMAACTVVLAYGKHRTIYRDHYEFRSIVQPGMTEDDVVARFGPPYRIYWTPTQVAPIFAGRGVYDRFDRDVSPDGDLPAEFAKVLHYRPTLTHGEFVFIGADGVVLMVVTGRTGGSSIRLGVAASLRDAGLRPRSAWTHLAPITRQGATSCPTATTTCWPASRRRPPPTGP